MNKSGLGDCCRTVPSLSKGLPTKGLWYPNGDKMDLVEFSEFINCGYNIEAGSATGGYQFLGGRHMCFLQPTKTNQVAALSCCFQVYLWILLHTCLTTVCIFLSPPFSY